MSSIYLRKAEIKDINRIMEIIEEGRASLKASGIPQWQSGTPNEEIFKEDIELGCCFLLIYSKEIVGVATLTLGEPNYSTIYEGCWIDDIYPYLTIHRMAISNTHRGQKLGRFFLSNLVSYGYSQGIKNFRIDTHELNIPMQNLINSFDFSYRGIIELGNSGEYRKAYELCL